MVTSYTSPKYTFSLLVTHVSEGQDNSRIQFQSEGVFVVGGDVRKDRREKSPLLLIETFRFSRSQTLLLKHLLSCELSASTKTAVTGSELSANFFLWNFIMALYKSAPAKPLKIASTNNFFAFSSI